MVFESNGRPTDLHRLIILGQNSTFFLVFCFVIISMDPHYYPYLI